MAITFYGKLAIAALLCVGFALLINAQDKPVTDVCLGCICEAISGCNRTATCTGGVCGLFRITWPYWADGGKQTLNGESPESESAYANCVNDPYCAADTIQNYMTKYAQDCNGDSQVDCYDYAAIHKLGGYGCKGELGYNYLNTLSNCLSLFQG
ncbi:invertebrate-type lysozyme 3-like [Rhagoletis pomonella]|uniref:invertebrate-type lysozyme 3-like n=1 Tax=Rhagoletis pomonella TaxID=28610 RepID=UPI00177DD208|nr:invertebrate-type lysozyme 3-like [Rhagoletis pomonella]